MAGLDFLGTAWLIFCLTKFLARLFVFSSFNFYFQVLLNCFQGKEYYSFLFIDDSLSLPEEVDFLNIEGKSTVKIIAVIEMPKANKKDNPKQFFL